MWGGIFKRKPNTGVTRPANSYFQIYRVSNSLFGPLKNTGKAISTKFSQAIEQLRYETYSLEKAICGTLLGHSVLDSTQICALIDAQSSQHAFADHVRRLLDANVRMIQLRDKSVAEQTLIERARCLAEKVQGTPTRWIMNDRTDLAAALNADGVHLGQDDLPIELARKILGPSKLIGWSTHNIQQARQAAFKGANYIGVGPVFPSETKSFDEFPGLEFVKQVADEIRLPAFAIGGIGPDNVGQIKNQGLTRVAVRGCVEPSRRLADNIHLLRKGAVMNQVANPYTAPNRSSAEAQPPITQSPKHHWLIGGAIALGPIVMIGWLVMTAHFKAFFEEFGVELPMATQAIFHPLNLLIPVIYAIVVWLTRRRSDRRPRYWVAILLIFLLLGYVAICSLALMLPAAAIYSAVTN